MGELTQAGDQLQSPMVTTESSFSRRLRSIVDVTNWMPNITTASLPQDEGSHEGPLVVLGVTGTLR